MDGHLVEEQYRSGIGPVMDPLYCDLYAIFLRKIRTEAHKAMGFSLMMGRHQAPEELVGLESGFSFDKTCFPGQVPYGLCIETFIKFFR
jgi:hypothetical protein